MFTDRLINELGLLKLQAKSSLVTSKIEAIPTPEPASQTIDEPNPATQAVAPLRDKQQAANEVKLDKNEFRLLVKMLQAINHHCIYENMHYDGTTVKYKHPKKTLVFSDITLADEDEIMHLSSLTDLLADKSLKRPTWEKLKVLKS